MLSVIAAGNAGDVTDTGGAPATRSSSLGVASTVDAYQLRDGLKVDAPSAVAGIAAGQMSDRLRLGRQRTHARTGQRHRGHDPGRQRRRLRRRSRRPTRPRWTARSPGSSGTTTTPPVAAARPVAPTNVTDCRCDRRDLHLDPGRLRRRHHRANDDIPVVPAAQGRHRQAARVGRGRDAQGDLRRRAPGHHQGHQRLASPTRCRASAREACTARSGVVKPDVAAPGDTIASAGMGTGLRTRWCISGTSMATPLTAGVRALVRSRHPD